MMSSLHLAASVLILLGMCSAGPVLYPAVSNLVIPVELSPQPFEFGFEFADGLGMSQYRRESADGTGAVAGSYGYQDSLGVNRVVDYTAGIDGYKAVVRTNEPGVANQNSADVVFVVRPPPPGALAQGLPKRQNRL